MTSYEIVKRAIKFAKPERIPLMFPWLGVSDVCTVGLKAPDKWRPQSEEEDEWRVIWEKPDPASGIVNTGYVKNAVIKNLDKIDTYDFPDPNDSSRYEDLGTRLNEARKSEK